MKKKINVENVKEVINYFKNTDKWLEDFNKVYPDAKWTDNDVLGIDHRDFPKLCVYYAGMINSKEEFLSLSKKLYDKIVTNKEDFLNEYFDEYEKIDYKNLNYDTLENTFSSLLISRLSQFNSTALSRNKDFREKRYGKDIESKIKYDNLVTMNTVVCSVDTIFVGDEAKINLNNYDGNYMDMPLDTIQQENHESLYSLSSIQDYDRGITNYVSIDLPDHMYYADKANGNRNNPEIPSKYSDLMSGNSFVTNVVRAFNSYDGYSKEFLRDSTDAEAEMLYVDGVSLKSIKDKSNTEKDYGALLCEAIKKGQAIDVVSNYKDKDNNVHTRITPVKLNLSKETKSKIDNEYFMSKHSKFRLTFFNWGPFKIKEKGLFEDKEAIHQASREERNNNILKSSNERIERFSKTNKLDLKPGKLIEKVNDLSKENKILLDIENNELENENDLDKSFYIESTHTKGLETAMEERINEIADDMSQEL